MAQKKTVAYMAIEEEPMVQSDSSGVPCYSIMACSYVLVLHSTGHYSDSSTSVIMGSVQHQHTKPRTVCTKDADALRMVK